MKNRTVLILLYIFSLGLLFLISFLPSDFRTVATPLATLLPVFIGACIYIPKNGRRIEALMGGGREEKAIAYLSFPVILLGIIFISVLTSLFLSLFGISDETNITVSFPTALVLYALVPAFVEECFYRFLPLLILKDEPRKNVLIFSSLVFAFAHLSFSSIPYALFAGVSFFLINLIAKSPFPSLILHILNNFIALIFVFYPQQNLLLSIIALLAVLSLLSLVLLYRRREYIGAFLRELFSESGENILGFELIIYLIVTCTVSLLLL